MTASTRFPYRLRLLVTGALLLLSLPVGAVAAGRSAARRAEWAAEIRRVVTPGFIRAIAHPAAVTPELARIHPDEPVVGVSFEGQSRAYSIYLLNSHEVVNDTVGGQPIVVTWCPLANLAVVYSRRLDHTARVFEASGSLLKNTVVLIDYETDSLWTAISGEALTGPEAGKRLTILPSAQQVPWGTWVRMHPETTIATYEGIQTPGFDSYKDYHRSRLRTGIHAVKNEDQRLEPKSMVVGLDLDGKQRAYPFAVFARTKIVSDVFRDVPLLLYHDEVTGHTAVYRREAGADGERVLTFGDLPTEVFDHDPTHVVSDLTTGTEWDLRTGEAVAGELQGAHLEPVPFENLYWFVWADHYPKTKLYPKTSLYRVRR